MTDEITYVPPKEPNRVYHFDFDDAPTDINIFLDGKRVGHLGFEELNGLAAVLITDLNLDPGHRRLGIGSEAIRILVEEYEYNVFAIPHDGQTRDDGAYLIDGGVALAYSLVEKGLINWYRPGEHYDEDSD